MVLPCAMLSRDDVCSETCSNCHVLLHRFTAALSPPRDSSRPEVGCDSLLFADLFLEWRWSELCSSF